MPVVSEGSVCVCCGKESHRVTEKFWKREGTDMVEYLRYRCQDPECEQRRTAQGYSYPYRTFWDVRA